MNKNIILVIIFAAVAVIGGAFWYLNMNNIGYPTTTTPNEQGYVPTTSTNESVGNTANPATVPIGSSKTNTTKPATQGTGASNSGSNLTPPALPN